MSGAGATQVRSASTRTSRGGARDGSETQRAEQLVEDWSERVTTWASRAIARGREELEDVWAEAQSVRRGER
jgi:hypothetical protein